MDDSADVAGQLVDRWLASSVVRRLAVDFDGNAEDVRAALVFLAGAHDVGKATPVFAVQHDRLAQQMRELGLYSLSKSELRRGLVHHSLVGHHVLAGWLRDRGWDVSNSRSWGVVVGGHHGAPPDSTTEGVSPDAYSELYGIGLWASVRGELLDRLATRTGVVERLERWRVGRLSAAFQVLSLFHL